MRKTYSMIWIVVRNSEIRENVKMKTVGSRIWREKKKRWKMRHRHCITWNVARST